MYGKENIYSLIDEEQTEYNPEALCDVCESNYGCYDFDGNYICSQCLELIEEYENIDYSSGIVFVVR